MAILFGSPEAAAILAQDKLRQSTVELMLCVNDSRYGQHTGYVDAIDLHGDGDILLALRGRRLRCRLVGGVLRIGTVEIDAKTYRTWVGNWCWDCARVTLDDAVAAISHLARRKWHCEQGETSLFCAYDEGHEITAADLRRVLEYPTP